MHVGKRFILYRILGNDLPPRHGTGQTEANLEFILEHEPALEDCEKRWVVNRIADVAVETRLLRLLESRRQSFLRIPFVESEYLERRFDFDGMPPELYFHRVEFRSRSQIERYRMIEWCYRHKNLYLMNLNAARNAALREGRTLAEWVMPFDGACFFTASGWAAVLEATARPGTARYLLVPLARMLDNGLLLDPAFRPESLDEPQIAFRRDAAEMFDERLRYGSMSKTALLHRLDIPGPWQHPWVLPWEKVDLMPSPDAGRFQQAGWVARLESGAAQPDTDRRKRNVQRWWSAARFCLSVEGHLLGRRLRPDRLCFFDETVLEAERRAWRDGVPALVELVAKLRLHAEDATHAQAPRLGNITSLALCGYFTQEVRFEKSAAELLRTWFHAHQSRTPPPLETRDLAHALDAVRLVCRSGAFSPEENATFGKWLHEVFGRLEPGDRGQRTPYSADSRGIDCELAFAALALFIGELGPLCYRFDVCKMRIAEIRATGLSRLKLVDLQLWANLARLSRTAGKDLWSMLLPLLDRVIDTDPTEPRLEILRAFASNPPSPDRYKLPACLPPANAVAPFWQLGLAGSDTD